VAAAQLVVNLIGNTSGFQKSMKDAGRTVSNLGRDFQSAGRTLTRVTAPLAAVGALSVRSFAQFDDAMTKSLAIMGDVSKAMQDDMSKAARDVALVTTFSAKEAAEAYFFLASAGFDAAQSIEALPKVATFAQAGNFNLARATDLLTDAMSALGLEMEDMERVGDVFVKANTLANASVEQFSESITSKAGTTLKRFEIDMIQGVAALAVFADAGLKGAQAGTILSRTIEGLEQRARLAPEAFKNMGVSVFDAEGNFREFADIVEELESALSHLSPEAREAELATLGLNQRTVQGIGLMLGSSKALREYASELENAGGTAQEVADKQLESFSAQMKLLQSNMNEAAIVIGERLAPVIRELANLVSQAVDWFRELSEEQQGWVIGIGGALVVLGPLLIIIGKVIAAVGLIIKAFGGAKIAAVTLTGVTIKLSQALIFLTKVAIIPLIKLGLKVLVVALGAILGPIGLVVAAIGGVSAAIVVWREDLNEIATFVIEWVGTILSKYTLLSDESIKIITGMMTGIKDNFFRGLDVIADFAEEKIDSITGFFKGMWDKVTGNSYVPDMMDDIEAEFRRLESIMVDPARIATDQVAEGFRGLESKLDGVFDAILGRASGFVNELANTLTGGTSGLGGVIAQLGSSIFGGGGVGGGPLGALLGAFQGGGSIMDALFGGGRPDGMIGPLMEDGSFFEGIFSGAGTSDAFFAAASGIMEGLSAIGQGTKETVQGIGQAGGAALGAYFGGPVGAKLGDMFGKALGGGIGKAVAKVFGGTTNPATLARRAFETELNNLIDGKNISIIDVDGALVPFKEFSVGSSKIWDEQDWAGKFREFAGESAESFDAVGRALGHYLGLSEDVHNQVGYMLFNSVGSYENLQRVIIGMNIPLADLEGSIVQAFENGDISLREYIVTLQKLRGVYADAEAAQHDLDKASEMFVETQGDSIASIRMFETVIKAAMNEGIKTTDEFAERLRQSGKFTDDQLRVLTDAFAAHGISSMEDLSNAGMEGLASIIAFMTSVAEDGGANFFELRSKAQDNFDQMEKDSKRAADNISGNFSNIRFNAQGNIKVTESAKGNVFSSGSVIPFAKGGVVSDFTMFNIGSMAERGPEAIMPLERLPDGRLGVLSAASSSEEKSGTTNVYHITGSRQDALAIRREIEKFNDVKNRAPGRFN
jgi:TP901 family phage tail tape measure protein